MIIWEPLIYHCIHIRVPNTDEISYNKLASQDSSNWSSLHLRRLWEYVRSELCSCTHTALDLYCTPVFTYKITIIIFKKIMKTLSEFIRSGFWRENKQFGTHLMKAIWGFIFPEDILMKSSSVKEKVASGFPPSYGPAFPQ